MGRGTRMLAERDPDLRDAQDRGRSLLDLLEALVERDASQQVCGDVGEESRLALALLGRPLRGCGSATRGSRRRSR